MVGEGKEAVNQCASCPMPAGKALELGTHGFTDDGRM